jgi:hypothetical protein
MSAMSSKYYICATIQFQIDGNLGFVAAMNELLVQSQNPGHLSLLPALPAAFRHGGHVKLNARGDVGVSVRWSKGLVTNAKLEFRSKHPWLLSSTASSVNRHLGNHVNTIAGQHKAESVSYTVSSPNKVTSNLPPCAAFDNSGVVSENEKMWNIGASTVSLIIREFPCNVCLFDEAATSQRCE